LDASTKATGTTHKRARERAEYGPSNAQIESHAISSRTFFNAIGHGTNPLTRERAARGAEFVATTEDAVEIG
jgi:hypothetical protein